LPQKSFINPLGKTQKISTGAALFPNSLITRPSTAAGCTIALRFHQHQSTTASFSAGANVHVEYTNTPPGFKTGY
jgi:quinolinate synthase